MTGRLTLNQTLAIGALSLGALAVFADPRDGHAVSIAPKDLAVMVQREVDHVDVRELADWIVAGRADFRVIDLRSAEEYAAYHVPGAEHVPVSSLADRRFDPTEKVVLYSEGGIHSAQAWFLLKARGARNAYILLGGLESWKDEILFPVLEPASTPFQRQRNDRLAQVARHFGGQPREAGGAVAGARAEAVQLPTVAVPAVPAGGAAPVAVRKRKEGC
ncbi:MAG: rhodanese-like domain-containing protein [Vicinamibacterales bacterium]|jgi:rhodanese-related sulfurtransferase|nr:rhodanese-like domain-containing protein [Vicinamibacterales bacterium]